MAHKGSHDHHDGDGMAHHRIHQHEKFDHFAKEFHLHEVNGMMDGPEPGANNTDAAGKPDGAAHNPELYTNHGESAHHGIAGENLKMAGYSRHNKSEGGHEVSVNMPGGSPC